jgi:hypothetical protein
MTSDITKSGCAQLEDEGTPQLFDNWFDPVESAVLAHGCAGSSKS